MFNKIEVSTIVKAISFFQANLDQEMIDEAIEDKIDMLVSETELSQLEAKVESSLENKVNNEDIIATLKDKIEHLLNACSLHGIGDIEEVEEMDELLKTLSVKK
jgi:hypothetical protein